MKRIFQLLIITIFITSLYNSVFAQDTITIVDAAVIDFNSDGYYEAVEIEFSDIIDDSDVQTSAVVDQEWIFSQDPVFGDTIYASAFSSTVTEIIGDGGNNDHYIKLTLASSLTSSRGPIYFRYTNENVDAITKQSATDTLYSFVIQSARDLAPPVITSVNSNPTPADTLIVGESITFTVDFLDTIPDPNLTILPLQYNGQDLNWSTSNAGDTYTGTYVVVEGDDDQFLPILQLIDVTAEDQDGNLSAEFDGVDVNKSIDAHTPTITDVTSNATILDTLIVSQSIIFSVDIDDLNPEDDLIITPAQYNGKDLNWGSIDGGDSYQGTYDIVNGDQDITFPLQLIGVQATDLAGNISNSFDGSDVAVTVDANEPEISSVISDAMVAETLLVGDTIVFTVNVVTPDGSLTVTPPDYNGRLLNWYTGDGGNTYTGIYNVTNGELDVTSDLNLTNVKLTDPAGNESTPKIGDVVSLIDANLPEITSVELKNMSKIIDDQDTLHITITSDSDNNNYTLVSGTVGGYSLLSIEDFDNTTMYALFNITERSYNIDSLENIEVVNLQLADAAGNLSNIITETKANPFHALFSVKPTATISGTESICHQDSIEIPVVLSGYAPFSITYTNVAAPPVTINDIPTNLYNLMIIADESLGSPLTYTITDVTDATGNSNIGDGSFILNINSLPTASFTSPTDGNNFDISQDSVDLIGFYSPLGEFSGSGVLSASDQFSPSLAGIGFHDLYYFYEDVNGCKDSATINVEVIAGGNITFSQGKTIYCSYTDTFSITGFNYTDSVGSFYLEGNPGGALINNPNGDTATIKPDLLIAGNSYNLTYSYPAGSDIKRSFAVEKIGSAITFTTIGDHCENYDTINIEAKSLSPLGGTGNYTLSDGAVNLHPDNYDNDISIYPEALTPDGINPKLYSLEYYYLTANGCISDTISEDFLINPLPDVTITMDALYDINGGTRLISGTPAVPAGSFAPSFMIDHTDGTATFDPEIAGLGIDLEAYYTYTDLNACVNTDTAIFTINEAEAQIFGLDTLANSNKQYCYYNSKIDTIWAIATNGDGDPGTFTINGDVVTNIIGKDSIIIDPEILRVGIDTIRFSYTNGAVNFYIEETFNLDSIGNTYFTGLDPEYCEDDNQEILLTCNRDDGTNVFATINGIADINNNDVNAEFNPSNAVLGSNIITYTFTRDYSNCYKEYNQSVEINKTPEFAFSLDNICVENENDSVLFTSDTLITDNVVDWYWRVNNSVTIQERYVDSSYFSLVPQINNSIALTLTTDKNCSNKIDTSIFIGSKVDLDFTWDKECDGETITFNVLQNTVPGGVDSIKWDFGGLGTIVDISDIYNPQFRYDAPGGYDVVYQEYTSTCDSISESKRIGIRPSITIENGGYVEDLEEHPDITGWAVDILESTVNPSWDWGPPNASIISSAASGSNAYVTDRTGNYNDNEKSYVTSPCFDFSALQKPMISLEFIADLELVYDGVKLEYSVEKDIWNTVGAFNEGINWYNSFNVISLGQSVGWTGNGNGADESEWNIAKFWLDDLMGEAGVRFRFVLGTNDGGTPMEGFGFDNIFIGERNRMVLLEHFANPEEDDFVKTQNIIKGIANDNPQDVLPIQFFTSFPSTNDVSNFYTAGPSARSLYFGISQVPYSVVDGGDRKFDYSSEHELENTHINRRMLEESKFEIKVKQGLDGTNLNVRATITAIDSVEKSKLSIRAVVVERDVNSYMNVVRAMLPDPAGVLIDEKWEINDSINLFQSWEIPTEVNVDSVTTIVFLQNEETKEIYQAAYTNIFSTVLTSINETFENILDIEYTVFPNPANEILTIKLYKSLTYALDINIFNNVGMLVKSGKLYKGNIQREININDLPAGVYYLKLGNTDKLFGTKKIIKTN
ncbi:MAG: T9SS type A sorting domain-containing protein [Bacteroidales bacterium]|jgi:hypothetical protein|nr:T9SS type A sorting domain-containing protein [Bacteroidales bacterium]